MFVRRSASPSRWIILVFWLASTPTVEARDAIRIAFPSGMNGEVVVVMNKAGLAQKNGLDAEFSAFQYGPPMMEALAAGAIDAVVTSMMPVAAYAAKVPGDIRIVAMVNSGGHALLVPNESTLGPSSLAGKKIGVSFSSDSHLDLLIRLKELNIQDKVELINVSPAEIPTALGNRSVDAVVARQPQALRLEKSGAKAIMTWPLRYLSIARTKFIAENPDKVQRYLQALRESMIFMASHPDESATWFAEYLRVDPALVKEVAQQDGALTNRDSGQIDLSPTTADREMVADRLQRAFEMKVIKTEVDPKKLLDIN